MRWFTGRIVAMILAGLTMSTASAAAQPLDFEPYLAAGGMFAQGFFVGAGAGAVLRLLGPVGVAGEAGVMGNGDGLVDAFAGDVVLSFPSAARSPAWLPFVAAGYSTTGVLTGGIDPGLRIWRARVGVKRWRASGHDTLIEFVQYVIRERRQTSLAPMVRVGVTFR